MKRFAVALLFSILTSCSGQETVTDTVAVDTREPLGVRYVGSPMLDVREQANDSAAIIASYQNGEALTILSESGEWVEVRTGDRSGWARAAELTTGEAKEQNEESPGPRFRVMPLPVSAPGAHGEIYIEADVNTDGDVVSVRIITNTTGSLSLADQNVAALRNGKFHPIVIKGERKPFKYYHRVTY